MLARIPRALLQIFLLAVLISLALGINYLSAAAPGTPPTCPLGYPGCDAPLNVGTAQQGKSGGLTLGSTLDIAGSTTIKIINKGGLGFWSDPLVPDTFKGYPAYTIDMGQLVEAANNGIRFPDGTVQVTAATSTSLAGILPMGKLFHVVDEKPAGTLGGKCTVGIANTRTLNKIVIPNDIGPSATLSGNRFTLPEGKYYIEASVPGYRLGRHKAALFNVTSGTVTMYGTSEMANDGPNAHTPSLIRGKFTITAPTTYTIQHRCQYTRGTDDLGAASNLGGWPEIYTVVTVWKLD